MTIIDDNIAPAQQWIELGYELKKHMDQFSQTQDTREMSIIAQLIIQLISMTKLLVLKPLKLDIAQNIDKINSDIINNAKSKNIQELSNIQTLQIKDIINKSQKENEGVVWLAFSFQFMAQFLDYLLDESVSVYDAAQKAYKDVLEPHHNTIQKGVFKTGFLTLPSREDFCTKTGLIITDELEQVFKNYKNTSDEICNQIIKMSNKVW